MGNKITKKVCKVLARTYLKVSDGWVYSTQNGLYICFPVTEKFSELFQESQLLGNDLKGSEDDNLTKGLSVNKISSSAALNLLKEHGAKKYQYLMAYRSFWMSFHRMGAAWKYCCASCNIL
ncbi:hypothetical protein ISN44_As11g036000 [Arabidopsis suecica]|uniref:Uncharacterized protein n=1 Tax=Arabidopsis suecica TaxID=45249 RepID=A0A8T1ZEI5_ARASU|nr:hypothetical protein ISN44_As11g036000 [Arabidopsis suecica]